MYCPRVLNRATWTVHFVDRDLPEPASELSYLREAPGDLVTWLDRMGLPDGLPFLLSPRFEYDVALNSYFLRANLRVAPWNSNANRARALARFLNFLHVARGNKPWQAATEADHLAFHQWRRREESGPRVEGSTWNQEVSLVNQFYEWAVSEGHSAVVPIPHRFYAGLLQQARWCGAGSRSRCQQRSRTTRAASGLSGCRALGGYRPSQTPACIARRCPGTSSAMP